MGVTIDVQVCLKMKEGGGEGSRWDRRGGKERKRNRKGKKHDFKSIGLKLSHFMLSSMLVIPIEDERMSIWRLRFSPELKILEQQKSKTACCLLPLTCLEDLKKWKFKDRKDKMRNREGVCVSLCVPPGRVLFLSCLCSPRIPWGGNVFVT